MTQASQPHIVVLHDSFPSYSHSDILDQIVCLVDRGARVSNWAMHDSKESTFDLRIGRYSCLQRTRFLTLPKVSSSTQLSLEERGRWVQDFLGQNNLEELNEVDAFYVCSPSLLIQLSPLFTVFEKFVLLNCQEEENFFTKDYTNRQSASFLFGRPNIILTPTQYLRRQFIQKGCPVTKVIFHPVGIDFNFFHSNFKRPIKHDITFLSIAKCMEKNGLEYALSAFAALPYRYNLTYRIIGDGPESEELKAFADELGISSQVTFLSQVDRGEIIEEMINADVFVLPMVTPKNGAKDGVPKALIEAQGMGLPAITTDHGGIPEIVINGETGLIAKERDIARLTESMHQLATNQELRNKLSSYARAHISRNFNLEILNRTFVSFFGFPALNYATNGHVVDSETLQKVQKLNSIGEHLLMKDDLQGAANAFAEAINLMPTFAPALNNLGVTHWKAEEPEISLQYFHAALELNANNRTSVVNCASVLLSLGLTFHARAIYSAYLEMNPYDIEVAKFITELDLFGEGRDSIISCCEALVHFGFTENAEIAMKSYIERHPYDRDLQTHAKSLHLA